MKNLTNNKTLAHKYMKGFTQPKHMERGFRRGKGKKRRTKRCDYERPRNWLERG